MPALMRSRADFELVGRQVAVGELLVALAEVLQRLQPRHLVRSF